MAFRLPAGFRRPTRGARCPRARLNAQNPAAPRPGRDRVHFRALTAPGNTNCATKCDQEQGSASRFDGQRLDGRLEDLISHARLLRVATQC